MSSSGDRDGRPAFSGTTAWARSLQTPLREFLRTETGGAAVLLGGGDGRARLGERRRRVVRPLWETKLSIELGDAGIDAAFASG